MTKTCSICLGFGTELEMSGLDNFRTSVLSLYLTSELQFSRYSIRSLPEGSLKPVFWPNQLFLDFFSLGSVPKFPAGVDEIFPKNFIPGIRNKACFDLFFLLCLLCPGPNPCSYLSAVFLLLTSFAHLNFTTISVYWGYLLSQYQWWVSITCICWGLI